MSKQNKLFLLDAMALIYRSYFAFQKNPRINSKGFNTGAILGFTNTLLDIIQKQKPTHIGVAFDTSAPTARHEEFESYKANREAMPEELSLAIPFIKSMVEAFRIPILILPGYEADDIIGTFAKKAEKEGFITYMMTPDKDYAQLVSENIFMYKPAFMGNDAQIWGIAEVLEKFGVERPEQVIDILGLWGDASDNIPGIPGIGEKRAKELIAQYGSVENVIVNAHNLKGKMAENVRDFAQQGLDSKRLATINLQVPLTFDAQDLLWEGPDKEKITHLFDELEFNTLARRMSEFWYEKPTLFSPIQTSESEKNNQGSLFEQEIGNQQDMSTVEHQYQLIETKEAIEELALELAELKEFCFDTETTALDAQQAELVGIAFSWQNQKAVFVYLPDNYDDALELLSPLKPVFENQSIKKIGQNLKYDLAVLSWYEIDVQGPFFDTMIAHYLIEPDMKHNMDFLAEKYLNYRPQSIKELIGSGSSAITMRQVDKNKVVQYACEDADITYQLYEYFAPLLKKTEVEKLFNEVEMPLVQVLTKMETHGVKLDTEALYRFSKELANEIELLETDIYLLAGHEFNIASPRQLGIVLFEELEIAEKPKMTKTKQYKTGEEVLVKLVKRHPIVERILDYRQLSKLKSTYVDSLPKLVNPRTGKIHTSYNQAVAATGRLSSNNPNLQNIPIRTERGREIRKAFVPSSENHVFLAADYSQIELRLMAHFSGDLQMINDFVLGKDIHRATAARVYGIAENEVTKEMRSHAKSVNFGIIYGISAFGLSENLNIPRAEAARIINAYFNEYPQIKKFMDKQIEFARAHGYVETILGRRRYLRDINSSNAVVRGFDERNAINAPIQGSSADMIKIAMINIHNELIAKKLSSKMVLQVHDELVFDVPKNEIEQVKELVISNMKNAIKLDVPIIVDSNTGNDWLEAH